MAVEIKGRVIVIGEVQTGIAASSGKEWKKQIFVIEETESQYPKKIALEAFNKDVGMNMGDVINAHVNLSSREYNGNYYNQISLWKFDVVESAPEAAAPPPPAAEIPPAATDSTAETDDIPF